MDICIVSSQQANEDTIVDKYSNSVEKNVKTVISIFKNDYNNVSAGTLSEAEA